MNLSVMTIEFTSLAFAIIQDSNFRIVMCLFSGMRIMVVALLQSLPQLLNVMALLFFLICVFALVGLQLFQGRFRQHCSVESSGAITDRLGLCTFEQSPFLGSIGRQCPASGTFSCLNLSSFFCTSIIHSPEHILAHLRCHLCLFQFYSILC
jgi:hypothetical protein